MECLSFGQGVQVYRDNRLVERIQGKALKWWKPLNLLRHEKLSLVPLPFYPMLTRYPRCKFLPIVLQNHGGIVECYTLAERPPVTSKILFTTSFTSLGITEAQRNMRKWIMLRLLRHSSENQFSPYSFHACPLSAWLEHQHSLCKSASSVIHAANCGIRTASWKPTKRKPT